MGILNWLGKPFQEQGGKGGIVKEMFKNLPEENINSVTSLTKSKEEGGTIYYCEAPFIKTVRTKNGAKMESFVNMSTLTNSAGFMRLDMKGLTSNREVFKENVLFKFQEPWEANPMATTAPNDFGICPYGKCPTGSCTHGVTTVPFIKMNNSEFKETAVIREMIRKEYATKRIYSKMVFVFRGEFEKAKWVKNIGKWEFAGSVFEMLDFSIIKSVEDSKIFRLHTNAICNPSIPNAEWFTQSTHPNKELSSTLLDKAKAEFQAANKTLDVKQGF